MAAQASTEIPSGPKIKLLLLGKTGHGKSATGNTILSEVEGQHTEVTFQSHASSSSVTAKVEKVSKEVYGRPIMVVDTPGVCDTDEEPDAILNEIGTAVEQSPEGYDAFVLVFRFPMRFTHEEHQAIEHLELLFGEEIYNYTIAVFTHGSTFHTDQERKRAAGEAVLTFEEEIYRDEFSKKKSALGPVIRKFKGGVVLFDNLEKDHEKRRAMVAELVKKVDELKQKSKKSCYDHHIFKAVRAMREKAAAELKVDLITAEKTKEESVMPLVQKKVHALFMDYLKSNTSCTIL